MKSCCLYIGGVCSQCGLPGTHMRQCPAGPTPPASTPQVASGGCIHLGQPTGAVALVKCQSCGGNVRLKYPVHACAAKGTCLPTVSGEGASHPEGHAFCRVSGGRCEAYTTI